MRIRIVVPVIMALFAAATLSAQTQVGTAFTYQGKLENSGSPANGSHDLRFTLYDAASGGSVIDGPICVDNVNLVDGLFTASVDFGASNVNFNGNARWLAIEVRPDSTVGNCASGTYTALSPRQPLTATPYALGLRLPYTTSGSNSSSGLLNITSTNGGAITGTSGTGNGNPIGVAGYSPDDGGIGVFGRATSTTGITYGGWFQSVSATGYGLRGDASSTTGANYGVYGSSASTSGNGVRGIATSTSGITDGGHFESASPSGRAVYAEATAATGTTYGVFGQSDSNAGYGVYGVATSTTSATSPTTHGVEGVAYSAYGAGVGGFNLSTTGGYGGLFRSDGANGIGLGGIATSDTGAVYGVVGQIDWPTASGFGVFSYGPIGSSSSKAFRIDHPDDPTNKYLMHYSAESPEIINFYSGKVTLDSQGEATVELPPYFAKINKDPRYILTAIGAPMPMLHIAQEIDEAALSAGARAEPGEVAPRCSFRIAGGAPGAKVSWEVKALRNDRWVQRHGAPVEVEKLDREKGTYQHPELYGQPPEKGVNFNAVRQATSPARE